MAVVSHNVVMEKMEKAVLEARRFQPVCAGSWIAGYLVEGF